MEMLKNSFKIILSLLLIFMMMILQESSCLRVQRFNLNNDWPRETNLRGDNILNKQRPQQRERLFIFLKEHLLGGNIYRRKMLIAKDREGQEKREQQEQKEPKPHKRQLNERKMINCAIVEGGSLQTFLRGWYERHFPMELNIEWQKLKTSNGLENISDSKNVLRFNNERRQQWTKEEYYDYTRVGRDKRLKYLPVIGSSSLFHLGKYFRDLLTNIKFHERPESNERELELLDNLYNIGDSISHRAASNHDMKLNSKHVRRTIHDYQPSKKILRLRSYNPYGQWSHSFQFYDPNYMWMGLGK